MQSSHTVMKLTGTVIPYLVQSLPVNDCGLSSIHFGENSLRKMIDGLISRQISGIMADQSVELYIDSNYRTRTSTVNESSKGNYVTNYAIRVANLYAGVHRTQS